jgi:hypothetical protein
MESSATQKAGLTQPMPASPFIGSMVEGPDQVVPLNVKAAPPKSTATQNVVEAQDTELSGVVLLPTGLGVHVLPLNLSAWPEKSVTTQNVEDLQDTDGRKLVPSMRVAVHTLPLNLNAKPLLSTATQNDFYT